MFGLLKAFEDAKPVYLLFEDKQQAQSFADFIHLYIQESGVGNGYSAYWHHRDEPPIGVDSPFPQANSSLRTDLVESMTYSIWRKRLALHDSELKNRQDEHRSCGPQCESKDGTIRFFFDPSKLPPRLQPEIGDLATIVDHHDFDRVIARVTKIENDKVTLFEPRYTGATDGETYQVPITNVMKIQDFYTRL